MAENLELDAQIKEKLSSIKDVHEKKLHEMESSCESKIFSMIQLSIKYTSDCIAEVLSYGQSPNETRIKKLCKSKINKLRELWKDVGKVEIDKKSVEEVMDENILAYLLKYRDPSNIDGYLPCDGDEDSKHLVCYIDDDYDEKGSQKTCSIEIYLKNLMNKYGYDIKDPETIPEILDDLLQKWNNNGYSIFDLFFNGKFKSSEKDCINTILDIYVDLSHRDKTQISLLNSSQRLWMTNIVVKIKDILDNFLAQESGDNLEYFKILLKKYVQYECEEKATEKKYESLLARANRKFSDIRFSLLNTRDNHKKGNWEDVDSLSRISEIFFDSVTDRSVLDTGFLYKNKGGNLYGNIENDEAYQNIYKEGTDILFDNKNEILKLLSDETTLVDYGCYTGDKAKSLLCGTNKSIRYQPVDVDEHLCEVAGENIASLNSDNITILKGIKSSGNITESIPSLKEKENLTYMFTGGSIGNYQDETIHDILSNTFEPKDGCKLVMDYYKAPTSFDGIKKLLECYDNDATEDWFINGLENLGFKPRFYDSKSGRQCTTDAVSYNYNPFNQHYNLKVFLKEFLKFSVHYEFSDNEGNKYYAEIGKDTHEMVIYKYIGDSIVKCSESDILKLKKLGEFPGKIVEGFEGVQDSQILNDLDSQIRKEILEGILQVLSNNPITPEKPKGPSTIPPKILFKNGNISNIKEIDNYPIEKLGDFLKSEIKNFILKGMINRFEGMNNLDTIVDSIFEEKFCCEGNTPQDIFDFIATKLGTKNVGSWFNVLSGNSKYKHIFVPLNFKKGKFYPIEISRRFSDEEIIKLLKDADREVDENHIFSTCNSEDGQKYNSKYLNVIIATTPKK